jgi:hypothetical protein
MRPAQSRYALTRGTKSIGDRGRRLEYDEVMSRAVTQTQLEPEARRETAPHVHHGALDHFTQPCRTSIVPARLFTAADAWSNAAGSLRPP